MTYVTSQATVARGVTVTIDGTTIGEIDDDGIPIPQTTTDDLEVTNQDSGDWKEYLAGRKDGGECEIKGNAVDGDAGQVALAAAAAAGSTCLFVTTFSSGSYQSFYGTVKTFDHTVENQILKFSSKVKVSGAPTYSTTLSALTGLTITGETRFPTFGGTVTRYTCTVATGDTTATVVPTCAAATAITLDGTSVTSGEGGSVTLGAVDTITEVEVAVKEASKAARVYFIDIYRPSS